MIKVVNKQAFDVEFQTTIFPDGTSQVWKLDASPGDELFIVWHFENEAELFHVCQLGVLINQVTGNNAELFAPYLPYGRQDKEVSNTSSFSFTVFRDILRASNVWTINTFDSHSVSGPTKLVKSMKPDKFHASILNHDIICFPDAGASERYKYSFNIDTHTHIMFEKVRNQLTGEITGLKLLGSTEIKDRSVLIVDDICDGGMTFIKVAEALKTYNPKSIDLAVSHGLFSKGRQVLHDAGINNIYTTNSLLRNPEGFKVW